MTTKRNRNTRVVNFIGSPGSGKSTEAARCVLDLKMQRELVEYVDEYAKTLLWQGRQDILAGCPIGVVGEQSMRLRTLKGQVDWVVTDAPLLQNLMYHSDYSMIPVVLAEFLSYENVVFLCPPLSSYEEEGRNESRGEALRLHERAVGMLNFFEIPFIEVDRKASFAEQLGLDAQ